MRALFSSLLLLCGNLTSVLCAEYYGNSTSSTSTSTSTSTYTSTETEFKTSTILETSSGLSVASALPSSITTTSYSTQTVTEDITEVSYNSALESDVTYTTITATPTIYYYFTTITSGAATYQYNDSTAIPSTLVPQVSAVSWTWSQFYTPVNLGTVYVIINNLNQTKTITSTNSSAIEASTQFVNNGTLQLLTRSDTNSDGTVTTTVPTGLGDTSVIAYPTPYFTVTDDISWDGEAPRTQAGGICCLEDTVASPIPQNHYPFPSSTGSTDSKDPRGWLYVATTFDIGYTGSQNISSLFAPATINSVLNYCTVEYPPGESGYCVSSSAAAEVTSIGDAGELLTTTVHVTDATSSSSATAAATPIPARLSSQVSPQTSSSVEVDPITASVPSSTASQTPQPTPATSTPQQTPSSVQPVETSATQSAPSAAPPSSSVEQSPTPSSVTSTPAASPLQQTSVPSGSSEPGSKSEAATPASDKSAPPATATAETPSAVVTVGVPPAASPTPSSNNAGGIIASIFATHATQTVSSGTTLATQGSSTSVGPAPTVNGGEPQPASGGQTGITVSIGSTSAVVQPVPISTSVGGSATVVPGAVIGSSTVPIGTTVSIGGAPVAVGITGSQTYLVVGDSSTILQLPPSSSPIYQPIDISTSISGSATVVPGIVVGSNTIPVGSTVSINNTPFAVATSGSRTYAVVNGATTPLAQPTVAAAPIVVGSNTVYANSATQYVVSGQTLAPGSTITVGSGLSTTAIALQTSGSQTLLVVGSSTSVLSASTPHQTLQPITAGSATLTPISNSAYAIGSQTLTPGGPAVTISGTPYSLASGATELVYGSSTTRLTAAAATPAPLTVGSAILTPISASEYAIGSQTLTPGGPAITVSGTPYSLASGATELVYGSSTIKLPVASATGSPPPITVGSSVITANSVSAYQIGSQTLSPGGPAITVSGTLYSLASGATELIAGGSTDVLSTEVGMYIWAGIGGAASTSNSTGSTSSSQSAVNGNSISITSPSGPSATSKPSGSQSTSKSAASQLRIGCLWVAVVTIVFLLIVSR